MSTKDLQQFYQKMQADAAVQQKLKAAPDKDSYLNLVVQMGKEKGFTFTREEVIQAIEDSHAKRTGGGKQELSDDQMENVAGGLMRFLERWYYERYTSGAVKCS